MSPNDARKEAESYRYRYQVMLREIVATARRRGQTEIGRKAEAMLAAVKQVDVSADETATGDARERLMGFEPLIVELGVRVGLDYGPPMGVPKWARLMLWTSPVLVLLVGFVALLERRRRMKALDDATVQAWQQEQTDPKHVVQAVDGGR